jgi:methylase of polypeptide subunit release factors
LIPRPETEILVDEVLLEVFPKIVEAESRAITAEKASAAEPPIGQDDGVESGLGTEDEKLRALMELHSLEDEEADARDESASTAGARVDGGEIEKKALEKKYKEKLLAEVSKPVQARQGQLNQRKSGGLAQVKLGPKKLISRDIKTGSRARILDVGTGSGCIAITLACELQKVGSLDSVDIVAVDKSLEAIEMAKKNASLLLKNNSLSNIKFLNGDFFDSQFVNSLGKFDVIVSNPPYVGEREKPSLAPEVLKFEPESAIFGGDEGHELIEKWAENFHHCLTESGFLFLEIGSAQADKMTDIFSKHGGYSDFKIIKDLSGHQRVFRVRKAKNG